MSTHSESSSASPKHPVKTAATPTNHAASLTPIDPRRTYEALGRFIERRSPYEKVILPDFGPGSLEGDEIAFTIVDPGIPESVRDKHVLIEKGRYQEFHEGHPPTLKSEVLEKQRPDPFQKWDLGDGVPRNIVKEVQIHHKHTRKIDGKACDATVVILYLGDAH